jgi:hypothetical protein
VLPDIEMFQAGAVGANGRVPELLEKLKAEYEKMSHETNLFKAQRDEYERKRESPSSCLAMPRIEDASAASFVLPWCCSASVGSPDAGGGRREEDTPVMSCGRKLGVEASFPCKACPRPKPSPFLAFLGAPGIHSLGSSMHWGICSAQMHP